MVSGDWPYTIICKVYIVGLVKGLISAYGQFELLVAQPQNDIPAHEPAQKYTSEWRLLGVDN